MKIPDVGEAVDLGFAIEQLGAKIVRGESPTPEEALTVLAAAVVAFTDDPEELAPFLTEAARVREDLLVDIAAKERLGPRPK